MTPMWLSYYVDGCEQALHCDNPHGPWAFVLSLTEWDEREFTGGEVRRGWRGMAREGVDGGGGEVEMERNGTRGLDKGGGERCTEHRG